MIPVLVSVIFILTLCLIVTLTVVLLKKKRMEDVPQIDANYYYCKDWDVDTVKDHCVIDMNE